MRPSVTGLACRACSSASSGKSLRMEREALQPTIAREKDVDDKGDVNETRPGRDIREIRDPELVGTTRTKISLNEIGRSNGGEIGLCCNRVGSAANRASEA